eukprot:CAMPEP_0114470500 /NCGR_PEP_ID=MMETSP0104-20121206/11299_1 /TAXON_ID=37642 ORGANISM="Paraphysomonas imperforata, Strain PA2" /NCGR_SAMPLE_ID=MMETSP0104 /ASSEMBLY_ACC=CAM_ASM_000202 /LENGTH=192 /DNA_ID=CAMNT_0001644257 /DNA_START=79 /DNA_END=657 /DNA_ORIENTATION=+
MADKDEKIIDEIEDIEQISAGDDGKLVDENNNASIEDSGGGVDKDEEGEDTAELEEEHEDNEDDEDDDDEGDEGGENNDIKYMNIEESSSHASTKEGFLQKMKRKLGIRPKIHHDNDDDEVTSISMKYIPPPAPHNMPSARDAAKARIYRREKVRYGKEKLAYYVDAMRSDTLNVSDLIMKSEQNVHYVKGI